MPRGTNASYSSSEAHVKPVVLAVQTVVMVLFFYETAMERTLGCYSWL